ncbi:MAG: hypothetical protein JO138_17885 [Acidobacteriaceae bacterium]|nr:hypothetical protein [Acidobacteriaceae bacterium]
MSTDGVTVLATAYIITPSAVAVAWDNAGPNAAAHRPWTAIVPQDVCRQGDDKRALRHLTAPGLR